MLGNDDYQDLEIEAVANEDSDGYEDVDTEAPVVPRGHPNRKRRVQTRRRVGGKRHKQLYRYEWELLDGYRPWLKSVDGNEYRARCIVCNKQFNSNRTAIDNHVTSDKHETNMAQHHNENQEVNNEDLDSFLNLVAYTKIMLACFFAKHRLPVVLIDDLLPFIIHISKHYQALKSVRMHRTTLTRVTLLLADVHHQWLIETLSSHSFSIMFDESTDISNQKHGSIIVNVFDEKLKKYVPAFFKLVQIYSIFDEDADATAESLYNLILGAFDHFRTIPKSNLIAFSSDSCSTMQGVHNSVAQRFQRDFEGIMIVRFPAHAIHNAGYKAFEELPFDIRSINREIYKFFKCSPKRLHALTQAQIYADLDVTTILRHAPTRWLSLGPVVKRNLDNYNAIITCVEEVVNEKPTESTKSLLKNLKDPITKCYLHILNFVIPTLENLNWITSA